MRDEKEKKKIVTRKGIISDLKKEARHIILIFAASGFLAFLIDAFIFTVANFDFEPETIFVELLAIALLGSLLIVPLIFIVFYSVMYFLYSSSKLLIVEDTLYQTIPYEKLNRAHSSKYTKWYNHGLYFKQYGKYTLVSPDFSIDFDGTKEYYLVILNLKKPKIISYYRKDAYKIQN
jgi:hypothetical protein